MARSSSATHINSSQSLVALTWTHLLPFVDLLSPFVTPSLGKVDSSLKKSYLLVSHGQVILSPSAGSRRLLMHSDCLPLRPGSHFPPGRARRAAAWSCHPERHLGSSRARTRLREEAYL